MADTGGAGSRRSIPIIAAPDTADPLSLCASGEPFALMVLGNSMEPEFRDGDVVIIEPEGLARDGSFVLAEADGTFVFRMLRRQSDGWRLQALQEGHPEIELADLSSVRGVIIQKSRPGKRRETRRYVE